MRKRSTPKPRRRLGALWTIQRATAIGLPAALASLLLWIGHSAYVGALLLPWVLALAITAFCGVSILWITMLDMVGNPRRGARVAPVRGFDIAVGLLLAGPALWVLSGLLSRS